MHDRLQRLTRELRAEKCPPRVLAKVRERIAGERPRSSFGLGFPALAAAAALATLITLGALCWNPGPTTGPSSAKPTQETARDPVQVAAETTMSLACIGQVLIEAGQRSEAVVRNKAVPPLSSGFKTLQTTLKKPIGL